MQTKTTLKPPSQTLKTLENPPAAVMARDISLLEQLVPMARLCKSQDTDYEQFSRSTCSSGRASLHFNRLITCSAHPDGLNRCKRISHAAMRTSGPPEMRWVSLHVVDLRAVQHQTLQGAVVATNVQLRGLGRVKRRAARCELCGNSQEFPPPRQTLR